MFFVSLSVLDVDLWMKWLEFGFGWFIGFGWIVNVGKVVLGYRG